MNSDEHNRVFGNPVNVIHYMDYSDEKGKPDNARYVPELVLWK